MTNQVLYRKYRPKNFDEVAGHESFKKIIKCELKQQKLSHALLFVGQRGTGKTSAARLIAKISNCLDNVQDPSTACDKCKSCLMFDKQNHPDIIEIDAASNNGVDEIRNIKQNISISPLVSSKKIYIIDEVHMLTTSAFNAFLKTLEEPPKFVFFILATTEMHKVPQTILSRCQLYNFNKLTVGDITSKLNEICDKENKRVDEEVLREIFYISEGSMRDALNILDQLFSLEKDDFNIEDMKEIFSVVSKKEKLNLLKNILLNKNEDVITFFNDIENKGINLKIFILSIINILKELIEYKIIKNYTNNTILEIGDAEQFNAFDIEYIVNLCESFVDTYEKLKSSTIGSVLLLINMFKQITPISVANNSVKNYMDDSAHKKEINIVSETDIKKKTNDIYINKEEKLETNNIKIVKNIYLEEIYYIEALVNSSSEQRIEIINKLNNIKNYSELSFINECNVLCVSDFAIIFTNKENSKVNFEYKNVINNHKFQNDVVKIFGKKYAILFIDRDDVPLIKVKYELMKDELKGKAFSPDEFYTGKIFSEEVKKNKSYEQAVEIFGKVKVE